MNPEEFQKLKERALRLLARRDHSAYELKQKLKQKAPVDEPAFAVLHDYLKQLGYMADEASLSQRWVKQWRSEGRGRQWIQGKLRTKGLPPVELRDDEDELESARLFLKRKGADTPKAKLARSLVSRGFSTSTVATLLKEFYARR